MTEAAWGTPSWLPPGVRRAQYLEAQEEARETREAERARAERAERRWDEAVTAALRNAELRGEYVDLAGRLSGYTGARTVADVLESARLASEREDQVAAAKASREPGELAHVFVDEPVILAARSETGLKLFNRARKFAEMVSARSRADAARAALEARVPPLREAPWWQGRATRRSVPQESVPQEYAPPAGVTWGQLSGWIERGWRP
jgi:hypothetical protein